MSNANNDNNTEQVAPNLTLKAEKNKFFQDLVNHTDDSKFTVPYKLSAELTDVVSTFYIVESGKNSTTFTLKNIMAWGPG